MGRYDDVDTEEETGTPQAAPKPVQARTISRGWAAADTLKNASSPYAQRLKVVEEPVLIKFLEDEPYASFSSHWVERKGQQSFTCIRDIDPKGCPLCDIGNRASNKFAFNVVLLEQNTDPVVRSYEVGTRVIDQLKNFHTDPRQGPLTKHYWAVSKTGKGPTSATSHLLVKERDLLDEWSMDPLTDELLSSMKKQAYGPDIIQIPEYKTLKAVAFEEEED